MGLFKLKPRTVIRNHSGKVVFGIRQTPRFFGGCRVAIHKFENADDIGCFHDHPAWAFRLVLWGGYIEEAFVSSRGSSFETGYYRYRKWFPGRFGIIRPEFQHRIHSLMARRSVSLWIRGPVISEINTRGC